MNQPRMPSPAILVAVVALVAALTGTAVAGQDAGTSAITKKKVKKIVRKEITKQIAGLPEGPPGPQGPPGQRGAAGEDATNLFAYIRDPGSNDPAVVHYGSGVTAVSDPAGNNVYRVTFNRSVVNCVVQAVSGTGDPEGPAFSRQLGTPVISMEVGGADQVDITFFEGVGIDTSFMITAFC